MRRPTILVLDAEESVLDGVREVFAERDVEIVSAASPGSALDVLRGAGAAVLLADGRLLGDDPSAWVARARRLSPSLVPIVLARPSSGRSPAPAYVFDVLAKPVAPAALRRAAERALEHHQLLDQVHALHRALRGRAGFAGLVGRSAAAEALRARIGRLAPGSGAVLFEGEPGSGRETAARALHEASGRAAAPFVVVDLAAPPSGGRAEEGREEDLRRAVADASGGTLHLRGAGDLDPERQRALLGLLARLDLGARGDGDGTGAEPRLTSSSHRDSAREVAAGRFRDDLLARLAPSVVHVPPLRERSEDIPLLAHHLAATIREIGGLPETGIAPETLDALERYAWPGNVGELRHAVEHALTVCSGGVVRPADLPAPLLRPRGGLHAPPTVSAESRFREAKRTIVDAFERSYLEDLLRHHRGNVTAAASHSGMLRSALQRLLRKHDLRSSQFRLERRSEARDRAS